jgi:hypothetical protein
MVTNGQAVQCFTGEPEVPLGITPKEFAGLQSSDSNQRTAFALHRGGSSGQDFSANRRTLARKERKTVTRTERVTPLLLANGCPFRLHRANWGANLSVGLEDSLDANAAKVAKK